MNNPGDLVRGIRPTAFLYTFLRVNLISCLLMRCKPILWQLLSKDSICKAFISMKFNKEFRKYFQNFPPDYVTIPRIMFYF